MELAFHPDALAEFKAEVSYYEAVQPGLGLAFADAVFRTTSTARRPCRSIADDIQNV